MRYARLYIHSPQDAIAPPGPWRPGVPTTSDPLAQTGTPKQPALVALKIWDPQDYDHTRWDANEEYEGRVWDLERKVWAEGPPPPRQHGFVIGERTLEKIGLSVVGKNCISRVLDLEVHELVEGASPVPQ